MHADERGRLEIALGIMRSGAPHLAEEQPALLERAGKAARPAAMHAQNEDQGKCRGRMHQAALTSSNVSRYMA